MSRRYRVVATNLLDPAAIPILAETCDLVVAQDNRPDTLRQAVVDADAIIARERLPDDIFDYAKQLKACVRHGVGLDFIPVAAATRAGIPVANVPDANTQAVIEHVVSVTLSMARRLPQLTVGFAAGDWNIRNRLSGVELHGRVLGIVGFGRIGRGVAAALHAAFGMRAIVHDPYASKLPDYAEAAELDEVFAQADVVTLHVPSTLATDRMVDARRLALMKPGSLLVNAARGSLIIDEALVAALAGGRPAAAALDVFEPEPLPDQHPFRGVPNLLLTPHTAALTAEGMVRMSVQSAEATLCILRKERPASLVNPEIWDAYVNR